MLRVGLNQSSKNHPIKEQLYDLLPPIKQNIQVRRVRLNRHRWKSGDKLVKEFLQCDSTYGLVSVNRPTKTYIHQHGDNAWCCLKDQPKESRTTSSYQRDDYIYIYIYIYISSTWLVLIRWIPLTLPVSTYRPSFLTMPVDWIQFLHRDDICMSLLVT